MCGIAGVLNLEPGPAPTEQVLRQMLAMLRHRGPDEFGIYADARVGLGSARLSIIDLSSGQQPISNEDGTLWIVFNGEIFNYVDLRPELELKGHTFATQSDTEVLLHLYEEYGPRCLERLNGQFAIAIWDTRTRSLFLARDRMGVRPLFYTAAGGRLVFGSEIKAILAESHTKAELDPVAIDQIFTFWSPLSPNTAFRGISELPPGHFLVAAGGAISVTRYWELGFLSADEHALSKSRDESEYIEEFEALLVDAARIRLRADVPVGAYLSGGLDSSTIAAVIRNFTHNRLDTFSIAFDDAGFDESRYQRRMAEFLGTDHQVVNTTHADIGRVFPDVIWHTEIPITRTSPAPMFLLSKLVRDCGYKVVLTGEGADEFLAGYDIFKEAKVRRFWARQPASRWRPQLLRRLYPDINWAGSGSPAFLAEFFRGGLTELDDPAYSHTIRWRNNRRGCRFFSGALRADLARSPAGAINAVDYPARFKNWGPLEQAQFIEATIFMSQYLLSSQGDRVAMAHSVEGRFPFLDYRVIDFCSRLPPAMKLHVLKEKFILKRLGRKWLPEEILRRPKRPYRAPIQRSFFNEAAQDYVPELLSAESLAKTGLFSSAAVGQLLRRVHDGRGLGESDEMALVGVLSTQLVHRQFVEKFERRTPLGAGDRVKVHVAQ